MYFEKIIYLSRKGPNYHLFVVENILYYRNFGLSKGLPGFDKLIYFQSSIELVKGRNI